MCGGWISFIRVGITAMFAKSLSLLLFGLVRRKGRMARETGFYTVSVSNAECTYRSVQRRFSFLILSEALDQSWMSAKVWYRHPRTVPDRPRFRDSCAPSESSCKRAECILLAGRSGTKWLEGGRYEINLDGQVLVHGAGGRILFLVSRSSACLPKLVWVHRLQRLQSVTARMTLTS
jgi:hypothetical protein